MLLRLSRKLSDTVIYCQAHHLPKLDRVVGDKINVRYMCSISYDKFKGLLQKDAAADRLVNLSSNRFIRNYPPGLHFFSANYDPISCWNTGSQMVALNYQSYDRFLAFNTAKFQANGCSGWVKKPSYMGGNLKTELTDFDGVDEYNEQIPEVDFEFEILGASFIPSHSKIFKKLKNAFFNITFFFKFCIWNAMAFPFLMCL